MSWYTAIIGFLKVFIRLPIFLLNLGSRLIRLVPVFLGLFGCLYETIGSIIVIPFAIISRALDYLVKGSLPCSRFLLMVAATMKDIWNKIHNSIFVNTPAYLVPFFVIAVEIYEVGFLVLELIGYLLPQLWNYAYALAFWYLIGAPYLIYIEENPSRANDTIEVFVRAFGLVLNTLKGGVDILITVYDVALPVWWQVVWFSYQFGYLLIQYTGYAVGLVPSIQYFTYYDPFGDIGRTFMLPQSDLTSGSTELKGEIKRKLEEMVQVLTPTIVWDSLDEGLNREMNHFRRQLISVSDNPVFSRFGQNPTFNLGASSAATAQTVLIILIRAFEVVGDIFYIFSEIVLINLTLFSSVWIQLLMLIPKLTCAAKNGNCAAKEAGISVLEDFIKAIQLEKLTGPIKIPGCTPQELGDVPCTCSVEEGGIFRSLPPCEVPKYICLSQPDDVGQIYYSENIEGQTSTPIRSTDPKLGCPNSYNTITASGRRLSYIPKCYTTCIFFEESPFVKDGWEFEICDGEKYFIGHCVHTNGKITYEEGRRSLLSQTSYEKIYLEKFRSVSPSDFEFKKKPTVTPPKPQETPGSFISIDRLMSSLDSYASINDGFLQNVCGGIGNKDFPLGENVKYSNVVQTMICMSRAYTKGGNRPNKRKLEEEEEESIKLPTEDDMYIKTREEYGPEPPKSAIYFYLRPFLDAGHNMLREKKNPLQIIEVFHLSLIDAHKNYIRQFNPNHVSPVGSTRGLMPMLVAQISNAYINRSLSDLEEYQERVRLGHNTDMFRPNHEDTDHPGMFRRSMISNAYDTGRLVSICGFNGYSCPDGTCAPNGDPRKCQPCTDYTTSCILKSVPHAINTKFEGFDVAFLFSGWLECWRDITLNPNKSPLQAFIDGKIRIFGVDPITWPPNLRFCFPLFIPLPLLPEFTWSYLKFVSQICGENSASSGGTGTCLCEQYGSEIEISDTYSQYVVGLPPAPVARINKSFVGLSFLFSRLVPEWVSDIWEYIISIWWSPQEYPDLVFLFNTQYQQFGQSETVALICFFANFPSFLFSYLFFYLPLVFLLLYGRKLAWKLASIPMRILQTMSKYLFDYLHYINTTYTVEKYGKYADVGDTRMKEALLGENVPEGGRDLDV